MTNDNIQKFSRLWTLDADKYVIVRFNVADSETEHSIIFQKERKIAELIENSEIAREVMRRMVAAGVQVVNKLPLE